MPVKPAALRPGSTLAVLSPASTPKPELVQAGIDCLNRLGYKTVLFPHALDRGPLYYAGTVQQRVADLHAAFADASIDGIVCTRGGWGSAEPAAHLDAKLIRTNPKVFVGYSDHTSLHIWLARETGLITFYGPMVAADFARANGFDPTSWDHAIGGDSAWSLSLNRWPARSSSWIVRRHPRRRLSFHPRRVAGHAVHNAPGKRRRPTNLVS